MEQRLRLYRNHTPACDSGYTKPIFEGDTSVPDCTCPINATGYLQNELTPDGKPKRILHRSVGTKDWSEARLTRECWLEWGQTTKPVSGVDKLKKKDVSVRDAVDFFFAYSDAAEARGDDSEDKYKVLLRKRLLPWCNTHGVTTIKALDDSALVKQFFMSWRNLNPTKNKKNVVVDLDVRLKPNTKRAELERFRAFLGFCVSNTWIETNWALRKPKSGVKGISVPSSEIERKTAFTADEFRNILKTLAEFEVNPGKVGLSKAVKQHVFARCLAFTGQRVSDISMLGPDHIITKRKGNHSRTYVNLTQIKTGAKVSVPISDKLAAMIRALPLASQLNEPFTLERRTRKVKYGTKFYFWTGPEHADVDSNITHWDDSIAFVLKRTEEKYGKFKHHATPHTFRHYFALSMLAKNVPIPRVSKWLGHSSIDITESHYSNPNEDWNEASYDEYMSAIEGFGDLDAA